MKLGRLAECLPALKIREIRLVLVRRAAYTTVKQKPAPNLKQQRGLVKRQDYFNFRKTIIYVPI